MKEPKTIEELKQWYQDMNLPPEETTRFFIGKNYEGAKAFGIYMDENTEDFIVYKNKADGTRAIRYQGKDQAHAVKELYLKLKEEVAKQKQNNIRYTTSSHQFNGGKRTASHRSSLTIGNVIVFVLVGVIIFISGIAAVFTPRRGYYLYNNDYYYYQNGSWYEYNQYNGWYRAEKPRELSRHYRDYYRSYDYDSYYYIDNFENSDYYVEPSSSSDDWDSSSSWDSGDSWDSGSTDWSSDW